MTIDEIDADETMTNGGLDDEEEESDGPVLVQTEEDEETEVTSQGNYGDDDSNDDEEDWTPSADSSPVASAVSRKTMKAKATALKKGQSRAKSEKTPRGLSSIQKQMTILAISDSDYDDVDMPTMHQGKGKRR